MKSKEWHRDRIDELKQEKLDSISKLTLLITSFLAIYTIAYIIYFHYLNKNEIITLLLLIVIMIIISHYFIKEMKKTSKRIQGKKKLLKRNYDVLLDREKSY